MSQTQPHVLLLVTDQQRGDCVGIEGHPVLQTPTMDYLATSGTRFRRAYAECPQCVPARRTLMSGQDPATHGMLQNDPGQHWMPPATIADQLNAAGYETHLSGKLHLSPKRKRYGFDGMELADSTRGDHNDYLDWLHGEAPSNRWAMAHGATPNGWIGRPSHLPEDKTHAYWCVSNAITFLEKRDPTSPFFLKVSFIDPHPPFTPPAFYFDRYDRCELPDPTIGDWVDPVDAPTRGIDIEMLEARSQGLELDRPQMQACRAGYYGLINHVDMQISRLLQYMRDTRLIDNTLIVFVSDHGEMLGDHRLFHKSWPYEASARVPLFVRAPDRFGCPRETVCDAPVGLQDVMPTILDGVGLDVPKSVTGRSIMPFIRGECPEWRHVLHGEHSGGTRPETAWHFLTDGRIKYVWYSQTGHEQLFDLETDPNEMKDLATSDQLEVWRELLMVQLTRRPEGFTDGKRMITGRSHGPFVPNTPVQGNPPPLVE